MTTYKLKIEFDDPGLRTIGLSRQQVTIVKSQGLAGAPVAWVTFFPMEFNTVTWSEQYSVYASTTQIQEGAEIFTRSTRPAVGGDVYTLRNGYFDNGVRNPDLPTNRYAVSNQDPNLRIDGVPLLTAGLYQGAVVNGQTTASPLNAVVVPFNDLSHFTPVERVQVFTSYYENNGLVISEVISPSLTVDLTEEVSRTIHYNAATNQFALGSL